MLERKSADPETVAVGIPQSLIATAILRRCPSGLVVRTTNAAWRQGIEIDYLSLAQTVPTNLTGLTRRAAPAIIVVRNLDGLESSGPRCRVPALEILLTFGGRALVIFVTVVFTACPKQILTYFWMIFIMP